MFLLGRPSHRAKWGIPVPQDSSQIIYVWFDALLNYLAPLERTDQSLPWPPSLQVVGKDILKFHGIYWPTLLMALGHQLPERIFVHGHWLVEGSKMSKSSGNHVKSLGQLLEEYDCDAIRFFMIKHGCALEDANFSECTLKTCIDSDLADTLGNFARRVTGDSLLPNRVWPTDVGPCLKFDLQFAELWTEGTSLCLSSFFFFFVFFSYPYSFLMIVFFFFLFAFRFGFVGL